MLRLLIALLGLVLIGGLSGCGFQLRQALLLPSELSRIRIEAVDPDAGLNRDLEVALRRSGAMTVAADSPAAGAARLRLPSASLVQRPLSVGDSGRVQEFALVYRVEIELIDAAGSVRVPLQVVELERIYSFDSAAALGSPGEEELVRAEMERDMVAAILRRIEAALH